MASQPNDTGAARQPAYSIIDHTYDVVVVGAGGSGLRATMGAAESGVEESFANGLLEYPHYTRPAEWQGRAVPPVLLSGHHAQVARWRCERSLELTARRRPELIAAARSAGRLDAADERYLQSLGL